MNGTESTRQHHDDVAGDPAAAEGTPAGEAIDELPGMNPDDQPGIPDEPVSPAEGGD